jgi:hypothetical protein
MKSDVISFRVVKEPYGWSVRRGEGMMMTPFRSRLLAIKHAKDFAKALQQCGELAEVVLEDASWPTEPPTQRRARPRTGL